MPNLYDIVRRPLITEKGVGVKETESTLVFEVARCVEDGSEAGGRDLVQGQGRRCPDHQRRGQGAPARQVCRFPARLEESVCAVEGWGESP
jgi:hypothetical protein